MKKFSDLLCSYVCCAPEAYSREALKRTLYPHAARFGFLAVWLCSPVCLRAIQEAGEVQNHEELLDVIRFYRYEVEQHGGFWLRRLNFRVSSQRLLDLYDQAQRHEARNGSVRTSLG